MADNKKHHYVPRFYLKLFSENGRSINLFNIPSQRTVLDAALKHQCYRDYYYGKDPHLEKGLSMIENDMATIMRKTISETRLPDPEAKLLFLLHVVIQNVRTVYAVDALEEQTDRLAKHILAPKMRELNLAPERLKITPNESATYSLMRALPYYTLNRH